MDEILKDLDLTGCPSSLLIQGKEIDLLRHVKNTLIKYAKDKNPENLRRIGKLLAKILDPIEEESRKT